MESSNISTSMWIGPTEEQIGKMLEYLGLSSLEELASEVIPQDILSPRSYNLPSPISEHEALEELRKLARKNQRLRSLLGLSFYDCIIPPPIVRHVLENPAWYTPYTPYQSEISQGRLECLFHFQTMVCELTGMEIANASLLDGASAAAEAMLFCARLQASPTRNVFLVAEECHPHEIEVVKTRANALGIKIRLEPTAKLQFKDDIFGVWLCYPDTYGHIADLKPIIKEAHDANILVVVTADLLALTLITSPGEMGADVVVGNSQRFGQPLGFGGPHAGFFATRNIFIRQIPGRLVGLSKDSRGKPVYRLTLAAREQHIRREKATSNICTAQALMACMAALYAIYHGPVGLKKIASRIHRLASQLAGMLEKIGFSIKNRPFFDTILVSVRNSMLRNHLIEEAYKKGYNIRPVEDDSILIALDERSNYNEIQELIQIFNQNQDCQSKEVLEFTIPESLLRRTPFLQQEVFNKYHNETSFMRFIHRLQSKDYSLLSGMIPLGSCTMKLTPSSTMLPLSWPEWQHIHPFVPTQQAQGYLELISQLGKWLCEITGMDAITFQPNAGSQGEYTGLLMIKKYHVEHGQPHRDICLIPKSAHGTNPASAAMAGLKVVTIECDKKGRIDEQHIEELLSKFGSNIAAIMITYPSTHGVFDSNIRKIIDLVHHSGGLVYLDGANLNAMLGLLRPGDLGADVCHINLHKTFAIPHGGGGPGVGPVAVKKHLIPYLPAHTFNASDISSSSIGAVSAAPYGSALLLVIPWLYILCLGYEGLRKSGLVAILNANYVIRRLSSFYPVVYTNEKGWVAHEGIIDLRQFKLINAEDVAKRLMDYGFHAPTLSWPVPNALMIEPTESEPFEELERFCRAMLEIYHEIQEIEQGKADPKNNLLKNAPHSLETLLEEPWHYPYSRTKAAYPLAELREWKFWPVCGRIDNVWGDRNPVCRG